MISRAQNVISLFLLIVAFTGCPGKKKLSSPTTPNDVNGMQWSLTQKGTILEIAYGSGEHFPQYAALHLEDSYFRMNYGSQSTWGTSVIIMPSFWERGALRQGAPISFFYQVVGPDLIISIIGNISSLSVTSEIRISPPNENSLTAKIAVSVVGDVDLDDRPGEAFKLVTLASMHISPSTWDCRSAFAGSRTFPIPSSQWIINPPIIESVFGLEGGTSSWKTNVPTIEVCLDRDVEITGWVKPSNNPNDDNVGFWGATNYLVRSWNYNLISKP